MSFSKATSFVFLLAILLLAQNLHAAMFPDLNSPVTTTADSPVQGADANIGLSCTDLDPLHGNITGTGCFATYYRVDGADSYTAPYPDIWIAGYHPIEDSYFASRFSPVFNSILATTSVDINPLGIAVDSNGDAWVTSYTSAGSSSVSRIDHAANSVSASISLPGNLAGIAIGPNGDVWVSGLTSKAVYRINASTNSLAATIGYVGLVAGSNTLYGPYGIAVDSNGNVWTSNQQAGTVSRINPTTNRIDANISVGTTPQGIAIDSNGGIWVANSGSKSVSHINPSTNQVDFTVYVGTTPYGIAVDSNQNVWVTNSGSKTVSRINPQSRNVDINIGVGSFPKGIAIDSNQNPWVANWSDANLSHINPKTNSVDFNVGSGGLRPISLGDFTGFALQNFVLKNGWKPGSSDASGWKPDSNGWKMYGGMNDGNIILPDGNHKIEYYSIDKNMNIEAKKTIWAAVGRLNIDASLYDLNAQPNKVLADKNFGVRGTITVTLGNLPASGAIVTTTINLNSYQTRTDQSGNFDLNFPAPHSDGDYSLSITASDGTGFSGVSAKTVVVIPQATGPQATKAEITFNSQPAHAYVGTLTDINLHVNGTSGNAENLVDGNFQVSGKKTIADQAPVAYGIINFSNQGNGNYFFRIRMPEATGGYTFSFTASISESEVPPNQLQFMVLEHSFTTTVQLGNNYQDYNFYVPGYIDRKISSVGSQTISAPQGKPSYYLAYDKAGGGLFGMLSLGGERLLEISGVAGSSFLLDYVQGLEGIENYYYFIFSKGGKDTIEKRVPEISSQTFLGRISPAFGFGTPDFQTVTSGLDYGNSEISIANDLKIPGGGEHTLVIRNLGRDGNRTKIGITRA